MKELKEYYGSLLGVATLALWFFATIMYLNGWNYSDGLYFLVSGLRWIATPIAAAWLYFIALPRIAEEQDAAKERRRLEYEDLINREVRKRLDEIRRKEWEAQQVEERAKRRAETKERRIKAVHDKWRKEFEEKLEAEHRLARTANAATEQAFNDFI